MSSHPLSAIDSLMSQAQKKFRNRDFASASQIYSSALDQLDTIEHILTHSYQNSLRSLYGLVQSHLNNHDQSFGAYNRVLQSDPLNVGTILRRALLFMKTGSYDKAWKDLQRAMVLEPQNHRIEFYVEQLNEKIAQLAEGDKRKYSIKQEISEVIRFPEVEEDMILNFSALRNIDKQSACSSRVSRVSKVSKSVSIIREPTATIEVEREFDMNFFLAALVKEIVLTKEEIMEIEKQTEVECEPNRLNQEINEECGGLSEVKVLFDSENPATEGILKSVLGFGLSAIDSISRTQSNISEGGESCKRMSVLQVKNIDGKVLKSAETGEREESDDEKSGSEIGFGRIQDIEDLGRKEVPVYKSHALKRKSSLRKGASITNRPKQKSLFERGKIDLFSVNIDGPVIGPQSGNDREVSSEQDEERVSDSVRVSINDYPEDIDATLSRRTSQNEQLPCPSGIGRSGLQRKESILKNSKRKYQDAQPDLQN